jgi:hypothetical protein
MFPTLFKDVRDARTFAGTSATGASLTLQADVTACIT